MQVPARLVVALLALLRAAKGEAGLSLRGLGSIRAAGCAARARRAGADVAGTPTTHVTAVATADLDREQASGPPAHPRPVYELAAAMRRVLGGNERYTRCLQDADADLARAQACADLVGQ
jgi:hypothetical protein